MRIPARVWDLVLLDWTLPDVSGVEALDAGADDLLDVTIRYLRRKLELPGEAKLIQTVRGVGFVLKEGAGKEA